VWMCFGMSVEAEQSVASVQCTSAPLSRKSVVRRESRRATPQLMWPAGVRQVAVSCRPVYYDALE
jgi:hypothetical protein